MVQVLWDKDVFICIINTMAASSHGIGNYNIDKLS